MSGRLNVLSVGCTSLRSKKCGRHREHVPVMTSRSFMYPSSYHIRNVGHGMLQGIHSVPASLKKSFMIIESSFMKIRHIVPCKGDYRGISFFYCTANCASIGNVPFNTSYMSPGFIFHHLGRTIISFTFFLYVPNKDKAHVRFVKAERLHENMNIIYVKSQTK